MCGTAVVSMNVCGSPCLCMCALSVCFCGELITLWLPACMCVRLFEWKKWFRWWLGIVKVIIFGVSTVEGLDWHVGFSPAAAAAFDWCEHWSRLSHHRISNEWLNRVLREKCWWIWGQIMGTEWSNLLVFCSLLNRFIIRFVVFRSDFHTWAIKFKFGLTFQLP